MFWQAYKKLKTNKESTGIDSVIVLDLYNKGRMSREVQIRFPVFKIVISYSVLIPFQLIHP